MSSSTAATLRSRCSTISFLSSSAMYWSTRVGIPSVNAFTFAAKPTGMSSKTPPTWK